MTFVHFCVFDFLHTLAFVLASDIDRYICGLEGVHLTLPPRIFSVQAESGTCYITGQWGRVQNKIKET